MTSLCPISSPGLLKIAELARRRGNARMDKILRAPPSVGAAMLASDEWRYFARGRRHVISRIYAVPYRDTSACLARFDLYRRLSAQIALTIYWEKVSRDAFSTPHRFASRGTRRGRIDDVSQTLCQPPDSCNNGQPAPTIDAQRTTCLRPRRQLRNFLRHGAARGTRHYICGRTPMSPATTP